MLSLAVRLRLVSIPLCMLFLSDLCQQNAAAAAAAAAGDDDDDDDEGKQHL